MTDNPIEITQIVSDEIGDGISRGAALKALENVAASIVEDLPSNVTLECAQIFIMNRCYQAINLLPFNLTHSPASDMGERPKRAQILWEAELHFNQFEDDLYDRLGGDAVEPFEYIGHDFYDQSIEIYGLKPSIELTDDDRTFIKREGFRTIYHDRKGSPEHPNVKRLRAALRSKPASGDATIRESALEEAANWMRQFIAHNGHGLATVMLAELTDANLKPKPSQEAG